MKKVFIFIFAALLLSSCTSTTKTFTDSADRFLKSHNFQEKLAIDPVTGHNKIEASIDSLYNYTKVAAICDTADVCLRIARGRVEVKTDCSEGGEKLAALLQKLFEAIDFNK